jgi:hypothetical protein
MKRLQLSKSLSETEASNSTIVTRTKRTMRNALLVAAHKHGPARARDIQAFEYDEKVAENTFHVITMRIDVP